MFLEKISYFAPDQIYYTDGSFRDTFTSYSIVKQLTNSQFETLCKNRLPDHSGIFIAEMAAIKSAIKYCSENAGRSLICTDSLSATQALIKNHNGAYNDILHMENMANDITIMWIPSHIGIPGNEYADKGAKESLKLQNVTEVPCIPKALTKPFNALYDLQNHVPKRPKYSEILSRSQCIMLTRWKELERQYLIRDTIMKGLIQMPTGNLFSLQCLPYHTTYSDRMPALENRSTSGENT
ncbi:hypothetical protein CVS40_3352 [Lucilia cuprina]|nr:hypothetical protein CVS40_3352 [Lucilia cuprina]